MSAHHEVRKVYFVSLTNFLIYRAGEVKQQPKERIRSTFLLLCQVIKAKCSTGEPGISCLELPASQPLPCCVAPANCISRVLARHGWEVSSFGEIRAGDSQLSNGMVFLGRTREVVFWHTAVSIWGATAIDQKRKVFRFKFLFTVSLSLHFLNLVH